MIGYTNRRGYTMAVNFVERIDDLVKVSNVLMSVSNKEHLDTFVPGLLEVNPEIRFYSTGGTFKALQDILGRKTASKSLVSVSDYTGQPEMQGGLVKTLDFEIYLGLLSETYNHAHADDLKRTGAVAFDMVVVNLYPFKQTIAKLESTTEMARANIDIGGPCMVRASAKNFIRVASVVDPLDYGRIVKEMVKENGGISLRTRLDLAKKAFAHTAEYDAAIASYLATRDAAQVKGCYRV
jgi:phosphoribosylaminoimidazolecarboxamide formyltransferase/IMP cyclohydrolase